MKKIFSAAVAGAFSLIMLTSCGSVPQNTVNCVDDLNGKIIGVQLGTTGDTYAEDIRTLPLKSTIRAQMPFRL